MSLLQTLSTGLMRRYVLYDRCLFLGTSAPVSNVTEEDGCMWGDKPKTQPYSVTSQGVNGMLLPRLMDCIVGYLFQCESIKHAVYQLAWRTINNAMKIWMAFSLIRGL